MYINFADLQETYIELVSDVEMAEKLVDTNHCSNDFIKRTYTRTFFAMIEGVISQLKMIALDVNSDVNILQSYEIQLLKESSASLSDNGKAKETKAKLRFMPNIIFSINSLAKVLKLTTEVNKSNDGYQAMLQAIKIRDRITHPKNKKCININNDDMIILGNANAWFHDELGKLLIQMENNHEIVSVKHNKT